MEQEQTNENLKHMIVLVGHPKAGKTTVLRMLICKLLKIEIKFDEIKIEHPNSLDVRVNCQPKDGGDYVLVATAGDDEETIKDNIKFIESSNCTVAITASQKCGSFLKIIRDYGDSKHIKPEEISREEKETDADLADRIYKSIVKNSEAV